METVIGVFSSRERAALAVRELLVGKVPQESIVFLTQSETEDKPAEKGPGTTFGELVGLGAGMSAGVVAATLLAVPGTGEVVALGVGAASLLGLVGAGIGAAVSEAAPDDSGATQVASDEKNSEEATFFREVLQAGRSLIVVRTEWQETASVASTILDRLGLGIRGRTPQRMQTAIRQIGDVAIVDVSGRITLGQENFTLGETVRELVEKGNKKILLNLRDVGYVDSSGLGELVRICATVRNKGGQLTLVNPSERVSDLLQITKLSKVFDIEADEATAIQALSRLQKPQAPSMISGTKGPLSSHTATPEPR